jgi:hypothetical protein
MPKVRLLSFNQYYLPLFVQKQSNGTSNKKINEEQPKMSAVHKRLQYKVEAPNGLPDGTRIRLIRKSFMGYKRTKFVMEFGWKQQK